MYFLEYIVLTILVASTIASAMWTDPCGGDEFETNDTSYLNLRTRRSSRDTRVLLNLQKGVETLKNLTILQMTDHVSNTNGLRRGWESYSKLFLTIIYFYNYIFIITVINNYLFVGFHFMVLHLRGMIG